MESKWHIDKQKELDYTKCKRLHKSAHTQDILLTIIYHIHWECQYHRAKQSLLFYLLVQTIALLFDIGFISLI